MQVIEISGDDATSLTNTLNFVRDAIFSDTDLDFDESTKTVTIRLLPPSVSRGSLRSLVLLFRGVHGVQIKTDRAGTGPHPIGSLKW
jgi:hypothetical protein